MDNKVQATLVLRVISAALFLICSSAIAQDIAERDCDFAHYEKEGPHKLNITRMWTAKERKCIVQITDKDASSKLRKFSITSEGLLSVMNDFGKSSHGARAFYLFPRKEIPKFEIFEESGSAVAVVTLASGQKARFSDTTGKLTAISGTLFTEAREIKKTNAGGFELNSFEGLLLDTGFQMGDAAYANPNRVSTLRDAGGATCRIKNSELFEYEYVPGTKTVRVARLKHRTDSELAAFLEGFADCQALDLSAIRPPAVVEAPETTPPLAAEPEVVAPLPSPSASPATPVCVDCAAVRQGTELIDAGQKDSVQEIKEATDAGIEATVPVSPSPTP